MLKPHHLLSLLASVGGACAVPDDADPELGSEHAPATASEALFRIGSRSGMCVDTHDANRDGTGAVTVRRCADSATTQVFRAVQVDASRDLRLEVYLTGQCLTVAGPAVDAGQHLVQRPCDGSPGQRFAWDGDALLVGYQKVGLPVSRELAIEYQDGDPREGVRVLTTRRDLEDRERWWMVPAIMGGPSTPHNGFVTVHTEAQLEAALAAATWGSVVIIDPTSTNDTLTLHQLPMNQVVPAGVTLRGRAPFGIDEPVRLLIPEERELPEGTWLLRTEDKSRITELRLIGNAREGAGQPATWGVLVGGEPGQAPVELTEVILDRLEIAQWTEAGVVAWGMHEGADRFECPAGGAERPEPFARIFRSFIHHNTSYGVLVAAGGRVELGGNFMSTHRTDVAATFHGANHYDVHDGLYTSSDGGAVLGVTGSCSVAGSHWQGGIAGGSFDVAFNAFLTGRAPTVQIRGTPCQQYEVHDNLSTRGQGELEIRKQPWSGADDCKVDGGPFVPGDDASILWDYDNRFDADNPLYGCPRGADCDTGELAVGDFDGDGKDDLFVGTGTGWWFSPRGKDGWRFLNRVPRRASDLRFGDFNKDGITDVIAIEGNRVVVSWGGRSPWFDLNSSDGAEIDQIVVGQFDLDPLPDLFVATGSRWNTSSGGTGPWSLYAFSSYPMRDLRFGDFTKDGVTDVFSIVDDHWSIVKAPGTGWQTINTHMDGLLEDMMVADFDGDGRADIGRKYPAWVGYFDTDDWTFSSGGSMDWEDLRESNAPMIGPMIGEFDGKPGDDFVFWNGGGEGNHRTFIASGGVHLEWLSTLWLR